MKRNYYKKIFLLSLCVIFKLASLNAQKVDNEKAYSYKILENDPENSKNLVLNFDPVYMDAYLPNISFGIGAGANYKFRNLIELSAYGYKSYGDRIRLLNTYNSNTIGGVPAKGTSKPAAYSHFGATVFFVKSVHKHKDEYLVTKEGNTEYYINIPAEVLTLYGARIGLQSFTSFIQTQSGEINFIGTHKEGYGASEMTFNGEEYSTMMNSKVLNFGIVRKRIKDVEYVVEPFSKKKFVGSTEIFIDALLATSIEFGDMKVYQRDTIKDPATSEYLMKTGTYSVNEKTLKNMLGARAGFNSILYLGLIGINYGGEIGFRPGPGPSSLGFYGIMKFGLALGTRINL